MGPKRSGAQEAVPLTGRKSSGTTSAWGWGSPPPRTYAGAFRERLTELLGSDPFKELLSFRRIGSFVIWPAQAMLRARLTDSERVDLVCRVLNRYGETVDGKNRFLTDDRTVAWDERVFAKMARWLVLDDCRIEGRINRNTTTLTEDIALTADGESSPELRSLDDSSESLYRILKPLFHEAFGPGGDKRLLAFYYVVGLGQSFAEVGARLNVDKSTISRWIATIENRLLPLIREELSTRGLTKVELTPVKDAVSQVDMI